MPDALPALGRMAALPWPIVVVTNQSVVGRGIIELQTLVDIHRRMLGEIEAAGGRIDAIYVCPHRPEEGCLCRKPQPGLLLQAAAELNLNLSQSILIGDSYSDILAAINAEVQPVYRQNEAYPMDVLHRSGDAGSVQVPVVNNLLEFAKVIDLTASKGKCPADVIYYHSAKLLYTGGANQSSWSGN